MTKKIDEVMQQAVERGVFPAAELLVARKEVILHHNHYGDAKKESIFDIASLTKPICTATLMMHLLSEKKIKLEERLPKWFTNVDYSHVQMTPFHLLSHTSGLPSWRPFYRDLPMDWVGNQKGKDYITQSCVRENLIADLGSQCEYSDLGYILLGAILEKVSGFSLDTLFEEKIAKPLGLKNTFFVKTDTKNQELRTKNQFAPTEDCPWRKKILQGEVHDQNAYAMGGVAGHAGLFSNGEDIHRFIIELLRCYCGKSDWIPQNVVRMFIDPNFYTSTLKHSGTYVLGWDTPTFATSSSGHYFSPHSIGHLGYTGCSIWIDLDRQFWVILLTNRIHPTTANHKIKTFRPRIHNLIWREWMSEK